MGKLLARVTLLCCFVASPGPAIAGAWEASRAQSTVTIGQNTVTADSSVKYTGYVPGERIPATLEYSGTCKIVFNGLNLFRPIPFAPPQVVTGEISNVKGTQSGLARLNLALGVDTDCDLATGDADGIDGASTIRMEIRVSTRSGDGESPAGGGAICGVRA